MMYYLDTDSLSWAHAGHAAIAVRIKRAGEENVATTVVSAIEILRGRQEFLLKASDGRQLVRAQQLLEASQELLEQLPIVSVDTRAAAEFDRLRIEKKLRKIGRADLLIACVAMAHVATV